MATVLAYHTQRLTNSMCSITAAISFDGIRVRYCGEITMAWYERFLDETSCQNFCPIPSASPSSGV
eukprot:5437038-Amphidinium_carterae.1